MTSFRKLLCAAAAAVMTTGVAAMLAGPAVAQPTVQPVGPKQYFAGQVNGNTGSSVLSVVGCPTPTATGAASNADGHPLPGQTVDVIRFVVPPPVAVGSDFLGYTGRAHKISADLEVSLENPPLAYLFHIADLSAYNVSATISPFINLPCDATYSMLFTPVNGGKNAMTSTVSLTAEAPHIAIIQPTPVTTAVETVGLHGTGFVPSTTYTVAECPQTSWVVPQNPCVNTNDVTVTTDTTGAFTHSFMPVPCTVILPSTCYIGVPLPSGVDTIELVGAAKIIVP
jgi:hypothetical protein